MCRRLQSKFSKWFGHLLLLFGHLLSIYSNRCETLDVLKLFKRDWPDSNRKQKVKKTKNKKQNSNMQTVVQWIIYSTPTVSVWACVCVRVSDVSCLLMVMQCFLSMSIHAHFIFASTLIMYFSCSHLTFFSFHSRIN